MTGFTSAVFSFLGGTAFRLLLTFFTERIRDRQEFNFEKERMELQNKLENDQVDRHIRMLEAQTNANIKVIHVEKGEDVGLLDLTNFQLAVKEVNTPTGIKEIDFWNSCIRPLLATVCIAVWVISLVMRNWVLTPWDLELIGAVLGIFVGSRITHTGK